MKNAAVLFLALAVVVCIAGVTFAAGKVAIVTNLDYDIKETYFSALEMVRKYGSDKIIHATWPLNYMDRQEQMVSIIAKLAADQNVKAIVINRAVPGTNAAIDKLLETRKDIFIAYCTPSYHQGENPSDAAARAAVTLEINELEMGGTIPAQAKKMGAKTLIHYSYPRHMGQPMLLTRKELMRAKCASLGIEFVDTTALDPMSDGLRDAEQFILEDVPKMVKKYGADTAFFSTNNRMQAPLISAVINTKAIYPQPPLPSPYEGFPLAFGIKSDFEKPNNLQGVISETRRIIKGKGAEGRLSTWPVPVDMMFTAGCVEYAFKVISGEASPDKLDKALLEKCFSNYAGVGVITTHYVDEFGKEYPNYLLTLMDYLNY
ncbi:MAG: DUF3798 domain-containing protein [Synergistaceae bacterium]|nr:DUF3798 domain-containing protein [Synergistaceae bacterium]